MKIFAPSKWIIAVALLIIGITGVEIFNQGFSVTRFNVIAWATIAIFAHWQLLEQDKNVSYWKARANEWRERYESTEELR